MSRRGDSRFTLVEVVVAVGILAIVLSSMLAIVAQAKAEIVRAGNDRARQHALQNATEWFLLANPDDLMVPEGILPPGYRADCEIIEVVDDLPEHAQQPMDGWRLVLYRITAEDNAGDLLGVNEVYRLVREELQ